MKNFLSNSKLTISIYNGKQSKYVKHRLAFFCRQLKPPPDRVRDATLGWPSNAHSGNTLDLAPMYHAY